MAFKSEKQLQSSIIEILKKETLFDIIKGAEELDNHLHRDINDKFIPGFQIDFQLRTLYARKSKAVLESLTSYEIISGEIIKNISIQKDTKGKKERLYPDILLNNKEKNNFSILELKKDKQTEREAVTELFAYAIELKNHLPNIADSDINLIIIATEFSTLLDHSICSLVLGSNFNVLALKPEIEDENIFLNIHIPDSWTDIWQNRLPDYAFSSVSLVPYEHKEVKDIPNTSFLYDIIDDLATFHGAKSGSHGFFIIWKNMSPFNTAADFCVSLYQFNPFVFMKASVLNNFALNTDEPLSKYILNNYNDIEYNHPDSLMNTAKEIKKFLDLYYNTHFEDFVSWTDHNFRESNFRNQALPLIVNSWGNIGDYIRYYFFHPSIKKGFFSKQQLNSPLYYKDPLFAIELINRISGYTLFDNGVYNFTSLFEYAKQFRELLNISEWYIENKNSEHNFEILQPRLFFGTIDMLSSIREIQYRVNYIDEIIESPKPLRISPYEAFDDTVENLEDYINWFTTHFLKNNSTHQYFFSKAINWCLLFMEFENNLDNDTKHQFKEELISYFKKSIRETLENEFINKYSNYGLSYYNSLLEVLNIEKITELSCIDDFNKEISSIDGEKIIANFDTILSFFDSIYPEVYHPLIPFDDVTFITKDWKKLQGQLIRRFNEGQKYGAIILDSNGNLAVGILPKEYHLLKPIEKPEEEVFVMLNESGIAICSLVSWDEVKDGTAFRQKKD